MYISLSLFTLSLSLCPHTHAACNSSVQLTQFSARARVHAQRTCNCYVTVEQARYITKTEETERDKENIKLAQQTKAGLGEFRINLASKKIKKELLKARAAHVAIAAHTRTLTLS